MASAVSPARGLVLTAFILVAALTYLGPIVEGDFFWHLRAGETVWASGGLPDGHFSTQWLGQLLLFLLWKLGGFGGVVAMRAVIYTSVLLVLFVWMRREGAPFYLAFIFIVLPAHLFLSFPSERPQIFSFLLFPVTLWLMETMRKGGRAFWAVPPILLLWANLHAAFVLGVAAVWIYFISEAVSFIRKKSGGARLLKAAAVAFSPALILAVWPGALTVLYQIAASVVVPGDYVNSIVEFMSPHRALIKLGEYNPAFWIFLGLVVFALIKYRRKMRLEHLALLIFLSAISLKSQRFMPFLLSTAPLVAGYYAPEWKEKLTGGRLMHYGFGVLTALWLFFLPPGLGSGVSGEFPAGAARYMKEARHPGRVFNYHGWAGYLMWSVPDARFFMPVEKLNDTIDSVYESIIRTGGGPAYGGRPQWRALMDAYGLDMAVMPGVSQFSGEIFPLAEALVAEPDWVLVYSDSVANVFVRSGPGSGRGSKGTGGLREAKQESLGAEFLYRQIAAGAERGLKRSNRKEPFRRSLKYAREKLGQE